LKHALITAIGAVALGVLVLACITRLGLLPVTTTTSLDRSRLRPELGKAHIVRVGLAEVADSPGHGDRSRMELFEDGRPLGPAHSRHDDIRNLGQGRYSHWGEQLYFSSSDGQDPRGSHHYDVKVPWRPGDTLLVVLLVLTVVTNGSGLGRVIARLEALSPAWPALAVLAAAAAFRITVAWTHGQDTFQYLVNGLIVSDARGWDSLAIDFSRGERVDPTWGSWDAHRPFYWIFFGAIYALTGPSVAISTAVNMGLGALSAMLIFDALRRISGTTLALISASVVAFSMVDTRMSLATCTEPLGAFLTALALWALVLGMHRGTRGDLKGPWWRRCWPFLAAGASLALANLVRPLNLLAAGGWPVAVVLVLAGAPKPAPRLPVRRAARLAGLVVLGFVLVLAPWIGRQRIKHGIWTLSANTAEMTYAATSPKFGAWDSRVSEIAAHTRTIRERVDFFARGTRENLRKHPGFYASIIGACLGRLVGGAAAPQRGPLLGFCAVLLATAVARRPQDRQALRRTLAIAAAGAILLWLPDRGLGWIPVIALLVCLVRRDPIAVPAALLASTALGLAMVGISEDPRFVSTLTWLSTPISLWLVQQATALVAGDRRRSTGGVVAGPRLGTGATPVAIIGDPVRAPATWGGAARPIRWAVAALAGVFVLGLGRALLAHIGEAGPAQPVALDGTEARSWIERAMAGPAPSPYAPLRARLVVRRAQVRDGFEMTLAAGRTIPHWNPLFQVSRPYAVTIFETWPTLPELYAVFPGQLPSLGWRDVVLVGVPVVRPAQGTSLEVIAIFPGGSNDVLQSDDPAQHAAHVTNLSKAPPAR